MAEQPKEQRKTSQEQEIKQEKEARMKKNLDSVAKWSAICVRIFELENQLLEAKEIKEKLEQENPNLISQVKGIIRKDQKPKTKEPAKEAPKAPKEGEAPAKVGEKRKDLPQKPSAEKPKKPNIEKRLEDLKERNLLPKNPEFYPTHREADQANEPLDPINVDE